MRIGSLFLLMNYSYNFFQIYIYLYLISDIFNFWLFCHDLQIIEVCCGYVNLLQIIFFSRYINLWIFNWLSGDLEAIVSWSKMWNNFSIWSRKNMLLVHKCYLVTWQLRFYRFRLWMDTHSLISQKEWMWLDAILHHIS